MMGLGEGSQPWPTSFRGDQGKAFIPHWGESLVLPGGDVVISFRGSDLVLCSSPLLLGTA